MLGALHKWWALRWRRGVGANRNSRSAGGVGGDRSAGQPNSSLNSRHLLRPPTQPSADSLTPSTTELANMTASSSGFTATAVPGTRGGESGEDGTHGGEEEEEEEDGAKRISVVSANGRVRVLNETAEAEEGFQGDHCLLVHHHYQQHQQQQQRRRKGGKTR